MSRVVQPIRVRTLHATHCWDCTLNPVCLPQSVEETELDQLDDIIERTLPLPRNALLFQEGMPFGAVYAVRSGALKTVILTPEGEEQITGFYLPGEIVGLDSIGNPYDCYSSTAVALEPTAVCTIPFVALESLACRSPGLRQHLFQRMSAEIRNDHQIMQLIAKRPAEARVASLLLSLSRRNIRRHLSGSQLHLPMSRADMGSFLGLALETVSRVLSEFQKRGLLAVQGKEIIILDDSLLCALAEQTLVTQGTSLHG